MLGNSRMIFPCEVEWYDSIAEELEVVFDVGCRNDNIFEKYGCEVHQFDPVDYSHVCTGIFNQVALGSQEGIGKYYWEYESMHQRKDLKGGKWDKLTHSAYDVPMTTVDQYCRLNGIAKIDLLKIDAEGMDYEILKGAVKMLPNIKRVQFEYWEDEEIMKGVKSVLKDYEISTIGGVPMNYKAIRK